MYNRNSKLINENLELGDLKRLVHPELHIDEYKSKMGDDCDVCVVSFKVSGKEPSADLVSFIEKGYNYVLDADVSSGEKEGGDYLVFVELDRTPELPKQIYEMMDDIMNLTEQSITEWRVRYQKSQKDHELSIESLNSLIPLTASEYTKRYGSEEEGDELSDKERADLDRMRATAGVKVNTKAPKNEYTESLRIAAGLK